MSAFTKDHAGGSALIVIADDSVASDAQVTSLPPLKEGSVLFTSTNDEKADFWKRRLAEVGISLETVNIDVKEIESDPKDVIEDKAEKVRKELERRGIFGSIAISEDTTFEGGPDKFPGSGTKKTIRAFRRKLHLLMELMELKDSDECDFHCSVGVIFPSGETKTMTATTKGRFVKTRSAAEGCSGKGLINTQFVPSDDPDGRTLSQMSWEDQKKYHPRGKAIEMALTEIGKKFSF